MEKGCGLVFGCFPLSMTILMNAASPQAMPRLVLKRSGPEGGSSVFFP